jgi:hypothetical protein
MSVWLRSKDECSSINDMASLSYKVFLSFAPDLDGLQPSLISLGKELRRPANLALQTPTKNKANTKERNN